MHSFIQSHFILLCFLTMFSLFFIITIKLFKFLNESHLKKSKLNKYQVKYIEIGKGIFSLRKAYDDKVITESEFLHNIIKFTEEK
jgi:NADH:ubiquinone oxidoreductase subunit 3 (subunit A)